MIFEINLFTPDKFTFATMEEKNNIRPFLLSIIIILNFSCSTVPPVTTALPANSNQQVFWNELKALCGKAFEGTVIHAPANDTVFKNQRLIMHVRSCSENKIRIPFMVGSDKSRTWVFTTSAGSLGLKHDHMHEDGKEDSITQYGGRTTHSGLPTLQLFPADQHTLNILPAAASNVWWVELVPGKYFTYNLRRVVTERFFTIRFDLSKPVVAPSAPWGWKD